MFSKKASGYILGKKPVYFIIVLLFLAVSFLLFGFVISSNISTSNEIPYSARSTVMVNRFLNSPECFAYMDKETGRVYPEIIDLSKFDDNQMDACYNELDNTMAFSFELKELGQICMTPNWKAKNFNRVPQIVLVIDNEGKISKQTILISMQK